MKCDGLEKKSFWVMLPMRQMDGDWKGRGRIDSVRVEWRERPVMIPMLQTRKDGKQNIVAKRPDLVY